MNEYLQHLSLTLKTRTFLIYQISRLSISQSMRYLCFDSKMHPDLLSNLEHLRFKAHLYLVLISHRFQWFVAHLLWLSFNQQYLLEHYFFLKVLSSFLRSSSDPSNLLSLKDLFSNHSPPRVISVSPNYQEPFF